MTRSKALELLVERTNSHFGHTPTTPSEFEELRADIEKEVGSTISLSSIKRIWGYVKYDGFPTASTLNTLARYIGCPGWHEFMMSDILNNADDSEFLMDSILSTDTLAEGTRLDVRWGSGKMCRMECIGHMRFRVLESSNIKLLADDTFTLHTLSVGHPVYATEIHRGDARIPAYIGAKKGGITILRIENQ